MKEKRWPTLKEVMRRAEFSGTPPLDQRTKEKLIEAFVDICYRREIDMMTDEFVMVCNNVLLDYGILYGQEGEEKSVPDTKRSRNRKDNGADPPVRKPRNTDHRADHEDGKRDKKASSRTRGGYSGANDHKQDRKPGQKTGKVSHRRTGDLPKGARNRSSGRKQ